MDSLAVIKVNNGIVLPRVFSGKTPNWGIGGVCDEKNEFVAESYYNGGWAEQGGYYPWEKEKYIDEEVVYVGLFLPHWGHFLIDLTCRMWCLPEICKINPNIKIAFIGEESPEKNHLRFLELLGVGAGQILHIKEPTRFRSVYVPQQGFKSCEWYSREFVEMLDYIVDGALNSSSDYSSLREMQKVYFTRRRFSKAVSSEFGESFFEECFCQNNYTVIAPESLSLDEQIYLWNNAKEIVCINGTIPLNMLFCRNKTLKLTVLNKTSIPHENPMILIKMRELDVEFVKVYKEPLKGYPKSLGEGPYLFDKTVEFDDYMIRRELKQEKSEEEVKRFFEKQEIAYFWYIIGIKRRTRLLLSRIVPKSIKQLRHKGI